MSQPTTRTPQPGDLLRYRLQLGSLSLNATRSIVRVLNDGRYVVEGRNNPTVEPKNVLAVLTVVSTSQSTPHHQQN